MVTGFALGTAAGLLSWYLTRGDLLWGPVIGLSVFGLSVYISRPHGKERKETRNLTARGLFTDLVYGYDAVVYFSIIALLFAFAFDLLVLQFLLHFALIPWGLLVQNILSEGPLTIGLCVFVGAGVVLHSADDIEFGKRALWCVPLLAAEIYAVLAVWGAIRPVEPILSGVAEFLLGTAIGSYVLWSLVLPLSIVASYGMFLLAWFLVKDEYFFADTGTHIEYNVYDHTGYSRSDRAFAARARAKLADFGPRAFMEDAHRRREDEWRRRTGR